MKLGSYRGGSISIALLALCAGAVSSAVDPPRAEAQTPPASGAASAAASPSASAAASPSASAAASSIEAAENDAAAKLSAYAWPAQASDEPKEEEWAGAADLGITTGPWKGEKFFLSGGWAVECSRRAVRDWLRITCSPKNKESDTLMGVIWGLGGDVSHVKGSFVLAGALEQYKKLPSRVDTELLKKMGASVTVTLQMKPGGSSMVQIDRIWWATNAYGEDGAVIVAPGFVVEASWALGEKAPTIAFR